MAKFVIINMNKYTLLERNRARFNHPKLTNRLNCNAFNIVSCFLINNTVAKKWASNFFFIYARSVIAKKTRSIYSGTKLS